MTTSPARDIQAERRAISAETALEAAWAGHDAAIEIDEPALAADLMEAARRLIAAIGRNPEARMTDAHLSIDQAIALDTELGVI